MRRWSACLLLAMLVGRAHADGETPAPNAPPPTAEAKAQAKAHSDEGTKLFNIQQYAKAADEYQQAYLLDPQPVYLYATAQAQRLGGDCTKALLSYRAYLRTKPGDDKAEKNIERCEQDLKDHPLGETRSTETLGIPAPVAPLVAAPMVAPPPEKLVSRPWTSDWVGHVLVGGGVVAAAAGTVVFLGARKTINDLNNAATYDDYAARRAAADSAKTKQTIGVSAMAVGGALVLGGVLHYVLHVQPVPDQGVTAAVTPSGATIGYAGAF